MKKLSLQLGSIKEMLTKEQMKKIVGGYGGGLGLGGTGTQRVQCNYTTAASSNNPYICYSPGDPGNCTLDCMVTFGLDPAIMATNCSCEWIHCKGLNGGTCV